MSAVQSTGEADNHKTGTKTAVNSQIVGGDGVFSRDSIIGVVVGLLSCVLLVVSVMVYRKYNKHYGYTQIHQEDN